MRSTPTDSEVRCRDVATSSPFAQARRLGEASTAASIRSVHQALQSGLLSSIGITKEPPPPCMDAERAYFAPDSIVRRVHGDFPSMLIGGLASLLFQMLHPLAMAGVAEHSRYQDDPLGRLERTAFFLGITTFGSNDDADEAIRRVRAVHKGVTGIATDGRPYAASDPELVTWVHAAEVYSFLAAADAYGPQTLGVAERDDYLEQMAKVARALGATWVPTTGAELAEYFEDVRPELAFTPEARTARNFVLRGVRWTPHELATYATMVGAAQGILPNWARSQLRLVKLPLADRLAVRPAALGISAAMRWIATPLDAPTP
jgi:uncharacterized protein (DUF2236 family)